MEKERERVEKYVKFVVITVASLPPDYTLAGV